MAELKFIKKINQKIKVITHTKPIDKDTDVADKSPQVIEKETYAEYKETLHTEGHRSITHTSEQTKSTISSDQRLWRDVDSIESDVDKLDKKTAKSKKKNAEIDMKVDRIISNKDGEN